MCKHPGGYKPVHTPKRILRPKAKNMFMDTKLELNPDVKFDWVFENYGRVEIQDNTTVPPKGDMIKYEHQNHKQ